MNHLNNLISHMTRAYVPNRIQFLRSLRASFDIEELKELCYELGIDYEDLPGDTKSAKTRALMEYSKRRNLDNQLVQRVLQARPGLNLRTHFVNPLGQPVFLNQNPSSLGRPPGRPTLPSAFKSSPKT